MQGSDGAPEAPPAGEEGDETTIHVRAAAAGDAESLEWLVRRFSPLLLSYAEMLIGSRLRRVYEPEDLLADVWMVALPRLSGLPPRSERLTPVVMKFLATTLRYVLSNVIQKQGRRLAAAADGSTADPLSRLADTTAGAVTRAVRAEQRETLRMAFDRLDELSRTIVLLRGFEQLGNEEIGRRLGLLPNTVAVKYRRALRTLRGLLPNSVLDDFPA